MHSPSTRPRRCATGVPETALPHLVRRPAPSLFPGTFDLQRPHPAQVHAQCSWKVDQDATWEKKRGRTGPGWVGERVWGGEQTVKGPRLSTCEGKTEKQARRPASDTLQTRAIHASRSSRTERHKSRRSVSKRWRAGLGRPRPRCGRTPGLSARAAHAARRLPQIRVEISCRERLGFQTVNRAVMFGQPGLASSRGWRSDTSTLVVLASARDANHGTMAHVPWLCVCADGASRPIARLGSNSSHSTVLASGTASGSLCARRMILYSTGGVLECSRAAQRLQGRSGEKKRDGRTREGHELRPGKRGGDRAAQGGFEAEGGRLNPRHAAESAQRRGERSEGGVQGCAPAHRDAQIGRIARALPSLARRCYGVEANSHDARECGCGETEQDEDRMRCGEERGEREERGGDLSTMQGDLGRVHERAGPMSRSDDGPCKTTRL